MPYHSSEEEEEEQQDQEEEEAAAAAPGLTEEEEEDQEEEENRNHNHHSQQQWQRQWRSSSPSAASTTSCARGMSTISSMICLSCKEIYGRRSAGTCRECYEEASETEEELKKEIEELKARIAFLKAWAPEAMAEDYTDLVLETSDGSKIRAHRAVLVSRSSVFRVMLENQMEESRSGTIKITDFSYEVLRLFVHYLYTAEVYPESLDECAYDLLALAEKYNVKHLKSVCEKYMTSKVNNDNALFSFEYANRHGAKILREAALSTIIDNIHELTAKEEYQDLVNRDAKLVVEIFEVYLAKQKHPNS